MVNRPLWVIPAVLGAAALGLAAVALRPLLAPQPDLLAPADPGCDLRAGPCTLHLPGGGAVTLDLEPRGIPVPRPLVITVATTGIEVAAVAVDFAGLHMNMGYNRRSLSPAGPGLYRGEGMLPVCVSGRMAWEARVLLTTRRGLLAAPFRFETVR
jgi:hypothetical protein